jgi:Predicted signaling protein consisting of a modified GGDEF domain and a DHH domain
MKSKRNLSIEILLILLAVCFVALDVVLVFINTTAFFIVLGVTVLVILVFIVRASAIRKRLAQLITGIGPGMSSTQQSLLSTMEIPVLITDSSNGVLWYNELFKKDFELKKDIYLEDISTIIPDFDAQACLTERGGSYVLGEKHYTMFSTGSIQGAETIYISILFNDTIQYREAERYRLTRPSVLMFTIDSMDEYNGTVRESERSEILAEVYRAMENFINNTNGIYVRLSSRNYVAIIEEQHIAQIIEKRFPILDTVRSITSANIPVTMSIGVGRGAKTLYENYIQARQALDMALGRGGDQVAMKTRNGYEFYGGTSKAVEKRNKVKSRIIANSMMDLMQGADNVLVMGHKNADLDALGAGIGIVRAARMAGTDAKVVINSKTTMARSLYDKLLAEGYGEVFLEPGEAPDHITKNTLLVVVDCHLPSLVESEEVLSACGGNIVLIDHHRRMVGYVSNTVLTYHEPYASSCCELIAELIQSIETAENKPNGIEAESMLSGIMLDTKNFTVRTGVRTFEAASYLRKLGADPTTTKLLFATDLETYRYKVDLVAAAQIYRGCAVVVTDQLPEKMRVVIPQAADDLLSIENISASIVAVKFQNRIHISSRSLGAYNVQLIMEHLGGGGHSTMAGVQIDDADLDTVRKLINDAIDNYLTVNASKE